MTEVSRELRNIFWTQNTPIFENWGWIFSQKKKKNRNFLKLANIFISQLIMNKLLRNLRNLFVSSFIHHHHSFPIIHSRLGRNVPVASLRSVESLKKQPITIAVASLRLVESLKKPPITNAEFEPKYHHFWKLKLDFFPIKKVFKFFSEIHSIFFF